MATPQNPFAINTNRAGDSVFNATAATPKPVASAPAQMQVSDKATTAGQLNTLLDSNSAYIKNARARANQATNRRGLINSSIGAGAGEQAAIESALPIASQDAQAFFTADQFNVNNENQFTRDDDMFQRAVYSQDRDAVLANAAAENQFGRQRDLQTGQQDFQSGQSALDRAQQLALQQGQQDFQSGESALEREQRLALQQGQQEFVGGQSALDRQQQAALQQNELGFSREQLSQQAQEAEQNRVLQKFLQGEQLSQQERLALREIDLTKTENALNREQQQSLQQGQQEFQAGQSVLDRQTQLTLQQLDADTRRDIVNVEADYRTLLQTSASAADILKQTTQNIGAITSNKDLSKEGKQAAINYQKELLRDSFDVLGKISNLNIASLVNFEGTVV